MKGRNVRKSGSSGKYEVVDSSFPFPMYSGNVRKLVQRQQTVISGRLQKQRSGPAAAIARALRAR